MRVVVLTGAGNTFTAGNDLKDFLENPPTGESSSVFRFLRALAHHSRPVVAGVEGMALASELLMFGEPFDSATTLRAGIINQVVPEALSREGAHFIQRLGSTEAREAFNSFLSKKK